MGAPQALGLLAVSGTERIRSEAWYRVAGSRPRLKPGLRVSRSLEGGEPSYRLYDPTSNRTQRMGARAYALMTRLDGRRTLDEAWEQTSAEMGNDAPTQGETMRFLAQLYRLDALASDRLVDAAEVTERDRTTARKQLLGRVQNPLFLRVKLFDPDRFLDATVWLFRPLFSKLGALLFGALMAWLLARTAANWPALTANAGDRILAVENLLVAAVVFPFLKLVHEIGHAYALKARGGEVHDVGIMFLVFIPMPYVEASSANALGSKWDRAVVAAGGMMFELSVAALAMLAWQNAEDGLVRSVTFNAMLIAASSTLLFNGNPLLRFDAYFMLSDAVEIPNLGTRANRHWQGIAKRALGLPDRTPEPTARERRWFLGYAPAAFAYRMTVLLGIALFVGGQYFFVGALLAAWTVFLGLVLPLIKGARHLATAPVTAGVRARAIGGVAVALSVLALLLGAVPVPYGTVAPAVVWVPRDAPINAAQSGEAGRPLVADGVAVTAGMAIVELADAALRAQHRRQLAVVDELRLRLRAATAQGVLDRRVLSEELAGASAALADIERQIAGLTVRAPRDGLARLRDPEDLPGRYVRRGDTIGYVIGDGEARLKALVPPDSIENVRDRTRAVAVRLASRPDDPVVVTVPPRELTGTTRTLPTPALAAQHGGPIALDPTADEALTAVLPFVEVELTLDQAIVERRIGERAWVRFDHGAEPIAPRLWRAARRTFLDRFRV